jgi:Holliday junction resolvase RusA-like endonuclease
MELFVPIHPVPASRPRVTRYGTYYGKRYTKFRKELKAWAEEELLMVPRSDPLSVRLLFITQRPKKPTLPYPRGDIDNFVKGVLDGLTGFMWEDDRQIVALSAGKRYATSLDTPGIDLLVQGVLVDATT